MTPIIPPISPDRVLIRLKEDELSNPIEPIRDLFDEYTIGAVRTQLRELVDIALSDEIYNDAKKRENLIDWHRKIEKGLEATYLIITRLDQPALPQIILA